MAGKSMKTIFDVLFRDRATAGANRVTGSLKKMGMGARGAKAALSGLNSGLAMTQRQMRGIMSGGIIGAGFLKVGSGLQKFIGNAVKQAGDLEYELATLKGISGATALEMERLAKAASKAGVETQFTPTQAVQGLQALAQQGFTTSQQLGALMPSLLLSGASGGKVPLADAAKLTAQVVKGFGRDAEEAGIMVDQMVKTTTKSGMAIEDLSNAMQYASSAAGNMGINFKSTLATVGLIKDIIPSAQVAGSAFQILTARLVKPVNQRKIKKNLGLDLVDEATGEFKDFGKALTIMVDNFAKKKGPKRGALIQEIFGARGMKAINPLIMQLSKGITTQTGEVLHGAAAWEHWMENLDPDNVKDFAKSMNDLKLDTLNGQLELLTGSVDTFMIELGKGAAAFSKKIVKSFLGGFNTMLSVFQELPSGLKSGISTFTLLGGTILKFVGILLLARTGLRLFGFSFKSLLFGIGKMLLIAAPLTLFFGGIALGAYGLYRAVSSNFGRAEKSTASFTDKVKMAFRGIVDIIKTGGLSEETEKAFLKMGKSPMLSAFFKRFIYMWRNAKKFFSGVVKGFDDGLQRLERPWKRFTDTVSQIFEIWTGGTQKAIKGTDEWDARGQVFGDHLVTLSEMVLELMTNVAGFAKNVAKSMEGITVQDVIDGFAALTSVVSGVGTVINGIGTAFSMVGRGIADGVGTLVVLFQGLGDVISGAWTGNKVQQKIGLANITKAMQGEFLSFDTPMKKMKRQVESLATAKASLARTRGRIAGRSQIAQNLAAQAPTIPKSMGLRDMDMARVQDAMKVDRGNESIDKLNKEFIRQREDLVRYKKSEEYGEATKEEKKDIAQTLKELTKAIKSSPEVVQVEVDGEKLFKIVMANAEADKEDSFEGPEMTPVMEQGG